jgi:hypothetical protein
MVATVEHLHAGSQLRVIKNRVRAFPAVSDARLNEFIQAGHVRASAKCASDENK